MSHLGRLKTAIRAATLISRSVHSTLAGSEAVGTSAQVQSLLGPAALLGPRCLHSSQVHRQATDVIASDLEQSTGQERFEVEAAAKGLDPYAEEWLSAPWGTEDSPVQVTSAFSERVVGVPDPYDDSIVWWASIKEGEPPKQIVDDGEFFVLKRIENPDAHGHH